MGEQTQIGVKVDKVLKDEVDIILRSLGIKPTTAISALYHYILRYRELPFTIDTHVNKPSTLFSNLFMDFTLLKVTLIDFYKKTENVNIVSKNELDLLNNIIKEFNANFRQIEKHLCQQDEEHGIDWNKAFNAAKRAFYVLQADIKFVDGLGYHLDDGGSIKLSLALKMILDAEKYP